MIDKERLVKRRIEFAEELHAGSVYRDIKARDSERELYEKRWFWELLQNAKDSVALDDKVNIRIKISDTEVSFSHTGNPFKEDEILSLIIQGSSKIEDDSKTGRFGTGFMTTYLLSKRVKITGQLKDEGGYFDFYLNRNATDIKKFFELQKASNDNFINSIQETSYMDDGEFQTQFVYKLDEKGKNTTKKGLQSLNKLIPFTQMFNNQIGTITVIDNGGIVTYEKSKIEDYLIQNNKVEEWELKTSNSEKVLKAYLIKDNQFDVVCVSEKEGGSESLLKLNAQFPKLFFTFPLIGTEEIGFPFIINSTLFDPKVERDGIYLNSDGNESNGISKNKDLISRASEVAISVFPEIIAKNNIQSTFNIFNLSKSKNYSWIDGIWLNDLKIDLIEKLIDKEFIPLTDKKYKYAELHIPYSPNEELLKKTWDLANNSKSFDVIPYAELNNWISIAKNFAVLKNKDVFDENNIVGSKVLKNYVAEKSKLDVLVEDLDLSVYDWLDTFYQLIIGDLNEFPLNEKILLNQTKNFVEAEDLSWDEIKDDKLITISNKIGLNFSENLISNEIQVFNITGVEAYKKDSAVENLKNSINQLDESGYSSDEKLEANADLLKWLIENSKKDIIKNLKILSLEKGKEDSNVVTRVFPTSKHLLLSPKDFFKGDFPLYSEIIRERDCMHPVYLASLANNDFDWLDRNDFIHYSPLVKRKEKLDLKTIDLLVHNSHDLAQLKDDDGNITADIELEFSDFAYLTSSEGHIYDRNTTTSSSLKIFNFLLNEAAIKDEFFNNGEEPIIINDKPIVFEKTLWLKRAKSIQWVNVKNIESEAGNKFVKEVPSSKNLSELIKDNDKLINTIRGEKQIAFLSKINVGVSDLIRNTLKTDEIRVSWDRALTTMITSGVNPELVQEIFGDPGIQDEYQKKLNDKKLINRNQEIGALIEKLFNELILKLRDQGINIQITRKPLGSDYLLTNESSDLVNSNKEEEVFKINDWLIELKATGQNYAAMTSLQAKTATNKKDNYALVVVPLNDTEPDINYVRENARVVGNIGYKLSNIMSEFNNIEAKKNQLLTGEDGISVNIEDHGVRFQVDSKVWDSNNGISISEFINTHFDN